MAAATADRNTPRTDGQIQEYPVAASTKIYKGTGVILNASGYAVPAADTVSTLPIGIAVEKVDNSSGANADLKVRVFKVGTFLVNKASAVAADLGKQTYWTDDNTVALSSTNSIKAGTITEITTSATVRIRIDASNQ